MLFEYSIPNMSRGTDLRDFGIQETKFITTNGNLESVKKV